MGSPVCKENGLHTLGISSSTCADHEKSRDEQLFYYYLHYIISNMMKIVTGKDGKVFVP
jgi:hypothetical protein